MKPCTNGQQNNISVPGSLQNPPNGVLAPFESLVYYMRAFAVNPIANGHEQFTIDQPFIVPQGFALLLDDVEATAVPANTGEPAATCGFIVVDNPSGSFNEQAGVQTSFDLGFGGGGPANPAFFSPGGAVGTNGGLFHIWGGSVFVHPGTPASQIAPDNIIASTSGSQPGQASMSFNPKSDQTDIGACLYMARRHVVFGGFSMWLGMMFAPIQSHAVLITYLVKGRLILADKLLERAF